MARQNEYGKFIISAGEVASYAVCPESWRLRTVKKVQPDASELSEEGQVLHNEWAKNYDEVLYLARYIRYLLILVALALVIYQLTNG